MDTIKRTVLLLVGVTLITSACTINVGGPSTTVADSVAPPVSTQPSASAPEPAPATTSTTEYRMTEFDLAAGDCFNDADYVDGYITLTDCERPHDNEVYAVFNVVEDGDWPGESVLTDEADSTCTSLFEAFVGIDYDSSDLYATYLYPSEDTWRTGDRAVVCMLYEPDTMLYGSMRDAQR